MKIDKKKLELLYQILKCILYRVKKFSTLTNNYKIIDEDFEERTDEIKVGKNLNIIKPKFLQSINNFRNYLLWKKHLGNKVGKNILLYLFGMQFFLMKI